MSAAVILTELWRSKRLSLQTFNRCAPFKPLDYSFKVQKFKAFWLVRRKRSYSKSEVEKYKRPSQ